MCYSQTLVTQRREAFVRLAGMACVTVVGAGYVGTVTAVCLAFLGHNVIGLDIDRARAEQLAAGQTPFHEPGMPERLEQALKSGRLSCEC